MQILSIHNIQEKDFLLEKMCEFGIGTKAKEWGEGRYKNHVQNKH